MAFEGNVRALMIAAGRLTAGAFLRLLDILMHKIKWSLVIIKKGEIIIILLLIFCHLNTKFQNISHIISLYNHLLINPEK